MHDLELKIAKLLRVGVVIAGLIIAMGWIWGVITSGDDLFQFKQYKSVPLSDSVRSCLQTGNYPALVVYFGLALLVMLPAARVLLTGILFLSQKERILGWIAIAVFFILTASFTLGMHV